MPRVINLKERKPKVIPEGAVYIGREFHMGGWHLPESKWRNRYKTPGDGALAEIIAKYERHLYDSGLINDIHELRGKDLACWCAPEACHGDVLLRLANG
jgi:Domain of unknown function (DUF4326)